MKKGNLARYTLDGLKKQGLSIKEKASTSVAVTQSLNEKFLSMSLKWIFSQKSILGFGTNQTSQ